MEEFLHSVGHVLALIIEAIALFIIAVGTVEALFQIVRVMAQPRSGGDQRRAVWLNFARWLVAALTFQLAADLIATSFSPTWNEIGHLAAIAGVRTFLSFFLDREVESTRRLQHERGTERAA